MVKFTFSDFYENFCFSGPSTEGFSPYDEECGGEEEDQLQPQQGPEAPEDLSLKWRNFWIFLIFNPNFPHP